MKVNLKEIMTRAWEIKRMNEDNIFGLCLKMAWAEAKAPKAETIDEIVKRLEGLGFSRWTKNGKDRMYIGAEALGLHCEYGRSGKVLQGEWQGRYLHHLMAEEMMNAKTYINLRDLKVYSTDADLADAAAEMSGFQVA